MSYLGYTPPGQIVSSAQIADRAVDTINIADNAIDYSKVANGMMVDRWYDEYAGFASISETFPADDTIPQITEGLEILSVSITPKSATNRIRVSFSGYLTTQINPATIIAALFSSASNDALASTQVTSATGNYVTPIILQHEFVPGNTSPITISLRVGTTGALFIFNGYYDSGRILGGSSKATLIC